MLYASKKLIVTILTLTILVSLVSCNKHETPVIEAFLPTLPETPYTYTNAVFPSSFSIPPLSFLNSIASDNPITDDGATLGRVLFYDPRLSQNYGVSCASCHKQEHAFADDQKFSKGFNAGLTARNSMAIMNTRFSFRFFWDFRSLFLENQVLEPIKNHIEMNMTLEEVVIRLKKFGYYETLFEKAFGTSEITSDRIAKALSQFIHSLTSYSSKYDVGVATNYSNFSQLEIDGKDLFFSGTVNCNNCHNTANFYATQGLVNGLNASFGDNGIGVITNNIDDYGKFKVATLRNIEVSAPYMHDGRFSTLEEVVEHYNSGIQAHPNLDDRLTVEGMTGGTPKQYNMTAYQKQSLVAFLKTLTDQSFLTDIRFSDPFK